MRPTLLLLLLVGAALPATAQTRFSQSHTFQRSTQAGAEVRIFTYAQFSRDCTPFDPPRIVVRTLPSHGTVVARPNPSTVTVLREGAPDCTGKVFPGTAVYYTPTPGFVGTDQFDYDVLGHSNDHDTVVVTVR